jgi:hypothetical protein
LAIAHHQKMHAATLQPIRILLDDGPNSGGKDLRSVPPPKGADKRDDRRVVVNASAASNLMMARGVESLRIEDGRVNAVREANDALRVDAPGEQFVPENTGHGDDNMRVSEAYLFRPLR